MELKSRTGLEVIKRGGEIKKEFSKSRIKQNLLHFKQRKCDKQNIKLTTQNIRNKLKTKRK